VKTISNVAESAKEGYGSKRAVLPMMMTLKELVMRIWNGLIWLRTDTVASSFEHFNKLLGSIKGEEFHEKLNEYWLSKGIL
jgi:hypothetical protein